MLLRQVKYWYAQEVSSKWFKLAIERKISANTIDALRCTLELRLAAVAIWVEQG
jgi:hypothetical protein